MPFSEKLIENVLPLRNSPIRSLIRTSPVVVRRAHALPESHSGARLGPTSRPEPQLPRRSGQISCGYATRRGGARARGRGRVGHDDVTTDPARLPFLDVVRFGAAFSAFVIVQLPLPPFGRPPELFEQPEP